MLDALNYLQLAAGAICGAVLMALVGFVYMHAVAIPAAKVEAVAAATHRAEVKAASQQKKAQDKIDAIEKQYLRQDATHAEQISALEQALEQAGTATNHPAKENGRATRADSNPACRYAIPRGVSGRLDDIGRPATGAHPTKPSAGVP